MSKQTNLNDYMKTTAVRRVDPSSNEQNNQNSSRMVDESQENDDQKQQQSPYSSCQYVYILPSDIETLWPKFQDNLRQIKEKRCDLESIIQMIQKNIQLHLTQRSNINVKNLVQYFDELSMKKREFYQYDLIPFMAKIALETKTAFENDTIQLLLQEEQLEQRFTKYQIAIILSNMFFCTLHEQRYSGNFPEIFDFSRLYFGGNQEEINTLKREKLKFLFNYFTMVYQNKINMDLYVSFERVMQKQINSKNLKNNDLPEVNVFDDKTIESGQNLMQIVFANKIIGGGVLNRGALQEEIRYLISPECLVGLLLFEELNKNEAFIIQGAQQVSEYSGYGKELKFVGEYDQEKSNINDKNNMLDIIIIGIDALNFHEKSDNKNFNNQYSISSIMREVNKAFVGFSGSDKILPIGKSSKKRGVITGNWGCGDFGGDKELKFIIQWLAASQSPINLLNYTTYGDSNFKVQIEEIVELVKRYQPEDIIIFLKEYNQLKQNYPLLSLFDYIASYIN